MPVSEVIAQIEAKYPQLKVAYGGDGEVVSCWREAYKAHKIILPARNYGLCDVHNDFLEKLLASDISLAAVKNGLHITTWPLVEYRQKIDNRLDEPLSALAEFTLTNSDITSAIRFNVYVNRMMFLENVIATGIIASAPLGATGYWSSVTRTLFREGFGLAFIAPTIGVNNLVLKTSDHVEVEFTRSCNIKLAADKDVIDLKIDEGARIEFTLSTNKVSIAGYDDFQCQKCRELRHGTRIVNKYAI